MKFGSFSKMLLSAAVALLLLAGTSTAMAAGHGDKKQAKYPNTTRQAPKDMQGGSPDESDKLTEAAKAIGAKDMAKAKSILEPFADGSKTKNKYVQAMANQYLTVLALNQGDVKTAIAHLQEALKIGYLPNDTYFDLQFELAGLYQNDGDFQKSLDTVAAWRKDGKLETADSYGLEGIDYYKLGQYDKAIAATKKAISMTDKPKPVWNQVLAASYAETGDTSQAVAAAKAQLAKNPDDMTTLHNAITVLVGAHQYDEAIQLLDKANAKGQLKESNDYITLAKLHMMKAQRADNAKPDSEAALAVLKEGEAKGVVKPGFESHRIMGDAYFYTDRLKQAITEYEAAAKTAPDGQMDLQVASLLGSERRHSAARSHARTAIKRGLKHPGQAYMIIAKAEQAMHNQSAAVAAMRKAEKDPTTRAKAQAWLKKAGR